MLLSHDQSRTAKVDIEGSLSIDGSLQVSSDLEVMGDMIARDTEHLAGNVSLGDRDSDEVKITGVIRSGHSSGALRIDDALHTTGSLSVDGNVGIGMTNPHEKLEVFGRVRISEGNQSTFGGHLYLSKQDGQPGRGQWHINIAPNNALNFAESNIADYRLVIKHGGNVGIGTDNPTAKLVVTGGETILEQEKWQTPTLQNGWVNFGSGYNNAGYFKDSLGTVHLRGLVKNGTGRTIFILPAGYRPAGRELYSVATSPNAMGRVDILSNGRVAILSGSSTWISLDGITFRVGV